jgi:hypothetical protein
MAGSNKATQFTVAIDGVSLNAKQRGRLNRAIQTAALTELASVGIQRFGTHIPKEWLGIWIGPWGGPANVTRPRVVKQVATRR